MATSLTVKQARKILGKLAENVSDEELEAEIKTAQLLKAICFNYISRKEKHGKT